MISKRLSRFLLVGGTNAVLHFSILNLSFAVLGTSRLFSSIIATLFAMTYSFLLNKNFVFKSRSAIKDEVLAFVAVTISGVLLIHNLVYAISLYVLDHNSGLVTFAYILLGGILNRDFIIINLATVVGAVFAMAWNYNGYRYFVFTKPEVKNEFQDQAN